MPNYTFRCNDCSNEQDVMADLKTADELTLVCVSCGGDMNRAPVTKLNVIGPAVAAKVHEKQQEERAYFAKACGHKHACRCGVKLTKQNPFKQEIRATHGFTDDI